MIKNKFTITMLELKPKWLTSLITAGLIEMIALFIVTCRRPSEGPLIISEAGMDGALLLVDKSVFPSPEGYQ